MLRSNTLFDGGRRNPRTPSAWRSVNGLLTILSALAGLGCFNLSDFEGVEPSWLPMLLRGIVTAVLALILTAFVKIFLVPRSRGDGKGSKGVRMYASGHLEWPTDESLEPNALANEEEAIRIAFARTSVAAASLHRRNVRRKENLPSTGPALACSRYRGRSFRVPVLHVVWSLRSRECFRPSQASNKRDVEVEASA